MRRGQAAVEFLILVGFMLLVFTTFYLVIKEREEVQRERAQQEEYVALAEIIEQELVLSEGVANGYRRTFEIPQTVNGQPYTVDLYPPQAPSEVVITTAEGEYVFYMQLELAQGSDINPGYNQIVKDDEGNISVTPTQTQAPALQCVSASDCYPPSGAAECLSYACVAGICQIGNQPVGHSCTGTGISCLDYACDGLGQCTGTDNCVLPGEFCDTILDTCVMGCTPGVSTDIAFNAGGNDLFGSTSGLLWSGPATQVTNPSSTGVCCGISECGSTSGCTSVGDYAQNNGWMCGNLPGSPVWAQCDSTNDGQMYGGQAKFCCSRWTSDPDGSGPINVGDYGFSDQGDPDKQEAGGCTDFSDNDCDGLPDGLDTADCTGDFVALDSSCTQDSTWEDLVATPSISVSHSDLAYDWIVDGTTMAIMMLPFDIPEVSGQVQDVSQNGYTYSISGATFRSGMGVSGSAYEFDGNDEIAIGTLGAGVDPFNDPFGARTVSFWMYPNPGLIGTLFGTTMGLYEEGGSGAGSAVYLEYPAGGGQPIVHAGAWIGNAPLAWVQYRLPGASTYQHVAYVYDFNNAQEIRLYIDGVLVNSTPTSAVLTAHGASGTIGGSSSMRFSDDTVGSPAGYDGLLDEFFVFDRALSSDHVALLAGPTYDRLASQETQDGEDWDVVVTPSNGISLLTPIQSNVVSVSPQSRPACISCTPPDPTNFHVQQVTSTSATISWTPALDTLDQLLYVSTQWSDITNWCGSGTNCVVATLLDESKSTYDLTGLTAGTQYYVHVYSRTDSACTGGFTPDQQSFTTPGSCAGCFISGVCYPDGTVGSSPNDCSECNVALNPTGWSVRADGSGCNDGLFCNTGDTCTAGVCQAGSTPSCGGQVCDEVTDTCVDCLTNADCPATQTCLSGNVCGCLGTQCTIGGSCYDDFDDNPANECQYCRTQSPMFWTNKAFGSSCTGSDACSIGDYCNSGVCYDGSTSACTTPPLDQCQDLGGGSYNCVECVTQSHCGSNGATEYACLTEDRWNSGGYWEYRSRIWFWTWDCTSNACVQNGPYMGTICNPTWYTDSATALSHCLDDGDPVTIPVCV